MTDLIDIYTTNIENNLSSINSKFSQCELCSSSQFKSIIKEIESLMKDTEKIIKNYEIEATMMSDNTNDSKLSTFKTSIMTNKKKLHKLKLDLKNSNEEGTAEKLITPDDELSYNSFNKLQKATRATIEMENMSNGILVDLDGQTNQMKNVNVKIGDMNDQLGASSSLLGGMLNTTNRNRLYIILMGVTLFIIFVIILTLKIVLK